MWTRFALAVAGAAIGLMSLHVVRAAPGPSLSPGAGGQVLLLVAGWSLAGAGVLALPLRRWQGALLLLLAGSWFTATWNSPGAARPLLGVGLATFALVPAVLVHLAVRTGGASRSAGLLFFGYGVTLGLEGLAAAAVFDPAAGGCSACPRNPLLLVDDQVAWTRLSLWGLRLESAWLALALVALLVWLVRAGATRRRHAGPLVVAAGAVLTLRLAQDIHSLPAGFLVDDGLAQRLWDWQAVGLTSLAAAVAADLVHTRRARRALAGIAGGLSSGDLAARLAAHLGDPRLTLAYPVAEGLVDRAGNRLDPAADGRSVTPIRRGAATIAVVGHRRDLDPRRVAELTDAVRLGLDHERLNAEVLAQWEGLRAAGGRLLEAGDTARRRLERDLHDGAQQSLVMLLLELALAGTPGLEEVEQHLRAAVEELRSIAHGIHPLVLDRAGLAVALSALAETRPLTVSAVPDGRYPTVVESTAYLLVERACAETAATVSIASSTSDGLVIDLTVRRPPPDLAVVADRITLLNGQLEVQQAADVHLRARIPLRPGDSSGTGAAGARVLTSTVISGTGGDGPDKTVDANTVGP